MNEANGAGLDGCAFCVRVDGGAVLSSANENAAQVAVAGAQRSGCDIYHHNVYNSPRYISNTVVTPCCHWSASAWCPQLAFVQRLPWLRRRTRPVWRQNQRRHLYSSKRATMLGSSGQISVQRTHSDRQVWWLCVHRTWPSLTDRLWYTGIRIGHHSQASGSSYIEMGNTKVVCSL